MVEALAKRIRSGYKVFCCQNYLTDRRYSHEQDSRQENTIFVASDSEREAKDHQMAGL